MYGPVPDAMVTVAEPLLFPQVLAVGAAFMFMAPPILLTVAEAVAVHPPAGLVTVTA